MTRRQFLQTSLGLLCGLGAATKAAPARLAENQICWEHFTEGEWWTVKGFASQWNSFHEARRGIAVLFAGCRPSLMTFRKTGDGPVYFELTGRLQKWRRLASKEDVGYAVDAGVYGFGVGRRVT